MTRVEILEEFRRLTTTERLAVLEAALHMVREDLQKAGRLEIQTEEKRQLAIAAEALLPDYEADDELTAFTALDSEDICAQG